MSIAKFRRAAVPRELEFEELVGWGSVLPVVVIMSHGADGQIKDLNAAATALHTCIDALDDKHGVNGYLLVFGGDPLNEGSPDIGALVARVANRVLLVATQHQIISEWGGFVEQGWGGRRPDGMSQLAGYTLFTTSYHENGSDICWSGLKCDKKNGTPVIPLQPSGMVEFLLDMKDEGVKFSAVLLLGGGPATAMDADILHEQGFDIYYHRVEKRRNLENGGVWGEVDGKSYLQDIAEL